MCVSVSVSVYMSVAVSVSESVPVSACVYVRVCVRTRARVSHPSLAHLSAGTTLSKKTCTYEYKPRKNQMRPTKETKETYERDLLTLSAKGNDQIDNSADF